MWTHESTVAKNSLYWSRGRRDTKHSFKQRIQAAERYFFEDEFLVL